MWSHITQPLALLTLVFGILALIGAWFASGVNGFLGFDQVHLYADAQTLLLASIALGVYTRIAVDEECRLNVKKSSRSKKRK